MKLEDVQKKLEALETRESGKGGSSETRVFKPSDGDQKIRITPSPDGDSFQEIFLHFNVNNQTFLCPKKNFGEECAVCDFATELYKAGDAESLEMSKKLYAKPRYYSPVFVRSEEDKGIRWWSYGVTVYKSFLKKFTNPDYGDFTNPKQGFDWTLSYTPANKSSTNFPQSELIPDRKSSNLLPEEEEVEKLISEAPKLNEILNRKSSQEVKEILDKYLSVSPEDASSETVKYGKDKSTLEAAIDSLNDE